MKFSEGMLEGLCKKGQGAAACRFLTIDEKGWVCGKLTEQRRDIDARAIYMKAQGDNCSGIAGDETCVRHSDRPAAEVLYIPCSADPRVFVCDECSLEENRGELFRWFKENKPSAPKPVRLDTKVLDTARMAAEQAKAMLQTMGHVHQVAMIVTGNDQVDLVAIDPHFYGSVETKRALVQSLRDFCNKVRAKAIITVGEGYKLTDQDEDRFRQNPDALKLFSVEELAAMGFGRKQECIWVSCQTRDADFDILIPFERDASGKVANILPKEETPTDRKMEGAFRIL